MKRGANFLAFVVESYGAFGKQATEVLQLLNATLNNAPARPFELSERAVREALSVALQRGNAFVSHNGSLAARAQAAMSRVESGLLMDTSNREVELGHREVVGMQ